MSYSVRRSLDFLDFLNTVPKKERNLILKRVSKNIQLFDALSEIAHNYKNRNLNKYIKKNLRSKLKRHNKVLNGLVCPKSVKCAKKRKELVEQSGGFLPILIPAAAAALGHLSGAIIRKVIK